jgi:hypothetical protein
VAETEQATAKISRRKKIEINKETLISLYHLLVVVVVVVVAK